MNTFGHESSTAPSALLDEHPLTVAGSLVDRVRTADELVTTSGLARALVLQALGDLRRVRLVERTGDGYTMPVERLCALAAAVSDESTPMDPVIGYGVTDDEGQVLERFFGGTTLRQVPTDQPKRLVALERIALEFDLGCRASSRLVPEHAAVRSNP